LKTKTTKNQTLKEKNGTLIWTFFIFNIAALIMLFFASYFDEFTADYKKIFSLRSFGILIAPLVLFIINGLLSSNAKAVLVFWRLHEPLPGARAFTKHGPADPRVSMAKLQSLHKQLPTTAKDQNVLWYSIYKKHLKDVAVMKSHQDFLLGRDITAIAFLLIWFAGIPLLFLGTPPIKWLYFGGLIVQYIVFAVVAQNHGKRFVTNVLATESSMEVKKAKVKK